MLQLLTTEPFHHGRTGRASQGLPAKANVAAKASAFIRQFPRHSAPEKV
jgi:hypothetical protein